MLVCQDHRETGATGQEWKRNILNCPSMKRKLDATAAKRHTNGSMRIFTEVKIRKNKKLEALEGKVTKKEQEKNIYF